MCIPSGSGSRQPGPPRGRSRVSPAPGSMPYDRVTRRSSGVSPCIRCSLAPAPAPARCGIIAGGARGDAGCIFNHVTCGMVVLRSRSRGGPPLHLRDREGPTTGGAIHAVFTMAPLMVRVWMPSGPIRSSWITAPRAWGRLVPCLTRPGGSAWIHPARMGSSLAPAWLSAICWSSPPWRRLSFWRRPSAAVPAL